MSCLEVEDDELVNVVCPGSITAEAEDRNYVGAYLTAIYPGANTHAVLGSNFILS